MNDLDLCLEVIQGHVNHCDVNSFKNTLARDIKFGVWGAIVFPQSGRGLRHVTPTIFGIWSNISSNYLSWWLQIWCPALY